MLDLNQLHIYQIYYDDASQQSLDTGFIPLDNSTNERPDWSEFWPIRRFLKEQTLPENDLYGFLSPKFGFKTKLNSAQLTEFIQRKYKPEIDAYIISPFWDQTGFFKNIFEQGEFCHNGLMSISKEFFKSIGYVVDLDNMITHSQNTVFCNYIIAKPRFWYRWLALAEHLFESVENKSDDLALRLAGTTDYWGTTSYPFKVFIQERLATLLLANESFNAVAYDTFNLPPLGPMLESYRTELIACDAYKQAYAKTGYPVFEAGYIEQRNIIVHKHNLSLQAASEVDGNQKP